MRRRLLAVVVATSLLVVVAFALPLAALVRSVARDRAITAAERDASALAPVLATTTDRDLLLSALERTTLGADGRLTVVLPDGTQVGDQTPLGNDALVAARRRAFSTATSAGIAIFSPVITGGGEVSVIRGRVPSDVLDAGVIEAWLALAAVAVVLVVAAALVADRLARSMTREADAVASTARALAGGDALVRATPGATPELADVAAALNLLADRIDALRSTERERVADLSHRLRTPLTALRLDADRAGAPELVAGVDRLEAEITELIRSARRPLHQSPVGARCDAVAVVSDRAAYWAPLAEDDGREWSLIAPDAPVEVAVDGPELAAAIDALVGNVFSHTADGTAYVLRVEIDGGEVVVVVDDGGAGIDAPGEMVARGGTGGASTGLGLDIVRQTAEAAGGALVVGASPEGGARVGVRLPVVSRSAS
ncbi:MAG TPA: HAMP domain-containing sensor histidine kinase [Acidimicrobiales bacterium]|nr:HAMP domain-containing sensor histidine kinase [Acidimicrobiales bacterium]